MKEEAILELVREGKIGIATVEGEARESLERGLEELEEYKSE